MEEKKVVTTEDLENECESNDEILEEVIEKEPLFAKAKRLVKGNKKKILAAGALLVTGTIGFVLGTKFDGDDYDDNIVDSTCEDIESDDSDSTEETEE